MGGSKKTVKNEPWAPAQPYILEGMRQTQQAFDVNQPRLQDMSRRAYDAFNTVAGSAFAVPDPFVTAAKQRAGAIAGGAFLGANPGQPTYRRMQGPATGRDPSMAMLAEMANDRRPAPGTGTLDRIAAGGANPADRQAAAVGEGRYLNAQPSADLYATVMGGDYLNGNPWLDQLIARTNAEVTRDANRLFAARGMGSGVGSAFADLLSRNLAANEGQLRYQNYNDAANRQLQAAGQSDAAWGGERGRMDAATGLIAANHNAAQDRALAAAQALGQAGQQGQAQRLAAAQALGGRFDAGQDRALSAAQASDAARSDQVAQMLQALGLVPGLREADYAGIAPALSLLNAAADIPYVGTAALNGQIRQASDGYNVQTTKTGGGLGALAGNLAGSFAGGLGGRLGGNVADLIRKSPA